MSKAAREAIWRLILPEIRKIVKEELGQSSVASGVR